MPTEPASPTNALEARIVRTSPLLWVFAVLLFGLLSALGTEALWDLADAVRPPDESALRESWVGKLEAERAALEQAPDPHRAAVESAEADLAAYERTVHTAEDNFHTWLLTRATIGGSGAEDQALRSRRDQLAKLRAERDAALAQLAQLNAGPDPLVEKRKELDRQIQAGQLRLEQKTAADQRTSELHALGLRVALLVPIWALAVFFWRRRQKSRFVTLLWGYWAFAVWMLLWGIAPYLPHYGGYAPLTAGVGLTFWGAWTTMRWLNRRAKSRLQRLVEKNISRLRCPGCERPYLVGRETSLLIGLSRRASRRHFNAQALRPRACAFCGLRLFGACAHCGNEQPVHLEHCAACSSPWEERPVGISPERVLRPDSPAT